MQKLLRKLNRGSYADIHEQQQLARAELERVQEALHSDHTNIVLKEKEKEVREKYMKITQSSCH